MVAPRAHIHSVAELDDDALSEFLAVFEILKLALRNQYSSGYTAYEHGRVGACRALEVSDDLSTFCHHAHRVVIPIVTDCVPQLKPWFDYEHALALPEHIRQFATEEYVYYEAGRNDDTELRVGFTHHKGIPSQFMRRILTSELNISRDWNWTSDLNYEQMIDTVARLKGEFIGIISLEEPIGFPPIELNANISIDGLAYVGKTTIATRLGQHFRRPVIDTGIIFRYMALKKLLRQRKPSAEELKHLILEPRLDLPLRTADVTAEAAVLASSPERRRIFSAVLHQVLSDLIPCIVVGRDAWQFLADGDIRIVIEADIVTRLKRRLLKVALSERQLPNIYDLRELIEMMDENDRVKLPPPKTPGILKLNNGPRLFSATMDEILSRLKIRVIA